MMWYDVVLAGLHYQRYQHTEKEALDCSTTGISVKCRAPERISVSEPILVLHFTTLINANPCMIWCHS